MAEKTRDSNSYLNGQAGADARALVRGVISLPPLPRRSQELLQMLSDPDLDMLRLTELVEQTPALAARILGVANSAFFATGNPVKSIPDAIIRLLGLDLVRHLGVSYVLSQPFDVAACRRFDPVRFWTGSMNLAVLAELLVTRLPLANAPETSEAYLAGLLHGLGLLALVHVAPDAMDGVLAVASARPEVGLNEIELALLGLDHAIAGAELASAWKLPESMAAAMGPISRCSRAGSHGILVNLISLCAEVNRRVRNNEPVDLTTGLAEQLNQLGIEHSAWAAVLEIWRERAGDIQALAAAFSGGRR